jgi:hypothetical protein
MSGNDTQASPPLNCYDKIRFTSISTVFFHIISLWCLKNCGLYKSAKKQIEKCTFVNAAPLVPATFYYYNVTQRSSNVRFQYQPSHCIFNLFHDSRNISLFESKWFLIGALHYIAEAPQNKIISISLLTDWICIWWSLTNDKWHCVLSFTSFADRKNDTVT